MNHILPPDQPTLERIVAAALAEDAPWGDITSRPSTRPFIEPSTACSSSRSLCEDETSRWYPWCRVAASMPRMTSEKNSP